MEGMVHNKRQPEAQAPTLGIWPQYTVGEVVPLSQKGLSLPTCQSLGLEEVPPLLAWVMVPTVSGECCPKGCMCL